MTKQINGDKLFVIDHHPAIPPSDQLKKWEDQWFNEEEHADVLLIQAFQAGADQELEACCELLRQWGYNETPPRLNRIRRPEPPSLKEQALMALERQSTRSVPSKASFQDCETIRRALEQLND
jgi:hypothetical protein